MPNAMLIPINKTPFKNIQLKDSVFFRQPECKNYRQSFKLIPHYSIDAIVYPMNSRDFPVTNQFFSLGNLFYRAQAPTPVPAPKTIAINTSLAEQLGLPVDFLNSSTALNIFSGNKVPVGSHPLAAVYAGHQFGQWNPQLGDGRAILLGELESTDGKLLDIQLKGAGPTPYSRMGDGRSPLGPVLREYLVSEAMSALGIPTTRSLAAVTTGEVVRREKPLPGAILTRVASSHVRIGTFQYFAARQMNSEVKQLADYCIQRHFPAALESDNPYVTFLKSVIERQARLIAQWQSVGFIHGVMNTDNILICGETIDYGPCAFLDEYNPAAVFSSIDRQGRYSYQNQPSIAQWNLAWLAQYMIPLLNSHEEKALELAKETIDDFWPTYNMCYAEIMCRKLGFEKSSEESLSLLTDLLKLMTQEKSDFTLTFHTLADYLSNDRDCDNSISNYFNLGSPFQEWISEWKSMLSHEYKHTLKDPQRRMRTNNPVVIPRNHLIEEAIEQATNENNFDKFKELLTTLKSPYEPPKQLQKFTAPPTPQQRVSQTFCGT